MEQGHVDNFFWKRHDADDVDVFDDVDVSVDARFFYFCQLSGRRQLQRSGFESTPKLKDEQLKAIGTGSIIYVTHSLTLCFNSPFRNLTICLKAFQFFARDTPWAKKELYPARQATTLTPTKDSQTSLTCNKFRK